MDVFKIIAIAMVGVISAAQLKELKSPAAMYVIIGASVLILIMIVDSLSQVVDVFNQVFIKAGLNSSIFSTIIKLIGLGYVTEFGSAICEDYGSTTLSKKIQLAGKISIFAVAIPILKNVITVIESLVK